MNILRKSCRCTSVLSKLFKLEFSDEELKILDVVTTKHPSYKFLFRLTADLANPLITEPTREVSLPVLVLYDRSFLQLCQFFQRDIFAILCLIQLRTYSQMVAAWKWRVWESFLKLIFNSEGNIYWPKEDVYIWMPIPMQMHRFQNAFHKGTLGKATAICIKFKQNIWKIPAKPQFFLSFRGIIKDFARFFFQVSRFPGQILVTKIEY